MGSDKYISFINFEWLGKIIITGIKVTSIHSITLNTNEIFKGN